MSPLIGYAGALVVGVGIALTAVGVARRSVTGVAVLERAGVAADARRAADPRRPLLARLGGAVTTRLGGATRWLTSGARDGRLRRRLDRAGIALPAEGFLAVKVTCLGVALLLALVAPLLLEVSLTRSVVVVALIGLAGYFGPELWVRAAGQRRQERITKALPETLDLLALTAQAGLGLEQGIAEVSGELPGPLGAELDRMLKEQQLGRSRRDALLGLIDRNSSEDLRQLATALLQADELGTPISTTLQVQARELRRKRRARARERAGTAPVKLLFPLVFGIFPAMFVVILGPGALEIFRVLISR